MLIHTEKDRILEFFSNLIVFGLMGSTLISAQVLVHLEEQSPDIGQGVHGLGTKTLEETGAGDQGHMFGYATDETEQLMPLTHVLATQLGYKLTQVCIAFFCKDFVFFRRVPM